MDAMEGKESPVEQLRAMAMTVIRFSEENPGYLAAIRLFKSGRFSPVPEMDSGEDMSEILRLANDLTGSMETIIRNGQEEGNIRDDIKPVELAIMIRMMVTSLMEKNPEIEWAMRNHEIDEQQLVTQYLALVESVIRGPGTADCLDKTDGES